jgi:hypothetical protein
MRLAAQMRGGFFPRYIHAIARGRRVNIVQLLGERFHVGRADELTLNDASLAIEELNIPEMGRKKTDLHTSLPTSHTSTLAPTLPHCTARPGRPYRNEKGECP